MSAIVSPQEGIYVAVYPGEQAGMQLSAIRYDELVTAAATGDAVPAWFATAAQLAWHIDLTGLPIGLG